MRAEIRFLRVVDRRFNAIKIWRHQSRQTDTDGGRSHHLGCGKRERERKASLQIRRFLVGERRERAFARRSQTGIEAEGFIIQRVSASCILPLCWIRGSWRVWSNHPWAVPPPLLFLRCQTRRHASSFPQSSATRHDTDPILPFNRISAIDSRRTIDILSETWFDMMYLCILSFLSNKGI